MRKHSIHAVLFVPRILLLLAFAILVPQALLSQSQASSMQAGASAEEVSSGPMFVTAYYPDWSIWTMKPWQVDYTAMTHVIHFSADPDPATAPYFSPVTKASDSLKLQYGSGNNDRSINFQDSLIFYAHKSGVKALICLGGIYGTGASNMAQVCNDINKIKQYVSSISAYCRRKGYDGVDIDWEFPNNQTDYANLVTVLRDTLNTWPTPGIITAAVYMMPTNPYLGANVALINAKVDQINLMNYDMGVSTYAGFNAPLKPGECKYAGGNWTAWTLQDHSVDLWINAGFDKSKLALGIPLYAWEFTGVDGPCQLRNGGQNYRSYANALSYMTQYPGSYRWDDSSKVPYLSFTDAGGTKHMVSYDDSISLAYKINWAKNKGVGGIMLYELLGGWVQSNPVGKRDPLLQAVKRAMAGDIFVPTTPAPPAPNTPSEGALNIPTSTNLGWSASVGAASYRVQVAANSSFTSPLVDRTGVLGTTLSVTTMAEGTTYYWRVSATNSAGTSAWSALRSFTTVPPPIPIPDIAGTLYFDANQNHVKDAAESLMAGWTVQLSGAASGTDTTDAAGSYGFYDLPSGSYTVSAQPRTLWSQTLPVTSPSYSVSVTSGAPTVDAPFGMYSSSAFGFPVERLWNIVSLPVTAPDARRTSVFPLAITEAYSFHDGYFAQDTLEVGPAYWIKFPSAHTVWVAGPTVSADTVDVMTGWNFIGSVSAPVPSANVVTVPPGIIMGSIYGYKRGVFASDTVYPGQGYWVQASDTGKVIISSLGLGSAPAKQASSFDMSGLHTLRFATASGETQSLAFGVAGAPRTMDMPPPPPAGAFDARFVTEGSYGAMARVLGATGDASAEFPIALKSATYPLVISWDMRASSELFRLRVSRDETVTLLGKGSMTIDHASGADGSSQTMSVVLEGRAASALPDAFALRQNYPNPFNSGTMLSFTIPAASQVRLEVFNVLGERVAVPLDREMGAGSFSIPFDASLLPSGVYFYKLSAFSAAGESFSRTNSMILSK